MELGRNGVGGAEFEVCGRQNACPLGYPVLIPRICDYLPLHGKRHRPLVADNMGLVPRGETWETPGTGGVVTGGRTTRGIHGGWSGGVACPEAEHDRTGIQQVSQPVTSPSAVWGRWSWGCSGGGCSGCGSR